MLQDDTLIASYMNEIVPLATRLALPLFSLYSEYVDGGGLMCYGPSLLEPRWHSCEDLNPFSPWPESMEQETTEQGPMAHKKEGLGGLT
jgi:hypothetical protein